MYKEKILKRPEFLNIENNPLYSITVTCAIILISIEIV